MASHAGNAPVLDLRTCVAGAQIAWVYALRTCLPLSLRLSNFAAIVVGWLQWLVALGAAIGVFMMRSDIPMALAIAALPLGSACRA